MTPESATRSRRQERTRREIIEAARQLILERGLEGFSLREVAKRADYTPGALYTYFENAEVLLGTVGMESLAGLGEYMAVVPRDLPATERVVELTEAYVRFAEERPDEYAIVFDRLTVPAESWEHFVQVAVPFTELVAAFADGVRSGSFAARPGFGPAEMAYGAWALAHGTVSLARKHLSALPDDLSSARGEALRAYVRGLAAEESAAEADGGSTKGDLR